MNILKITNLLNNGTADYKGLDLAKIQAGTQLYPPDENTAYFYYSGDLIEHAEISVITQSEYETTKSGINASTGESIEEKIASLFQSQSNQDEIIMNLVMRV